jgi:hypothetical protein
LRSNAIKQLPWSIQTEKQIIVHTLAGAGNECGCLPLMRNLQSHEFFRERRSAHCGKMREVI